MQIRVAAAIDSLLREQKFSEKSDLVKSFKGLEERDVIVSYRPSKERAFSIDGGGIGYITNTEDAYVPMHLK